MIPKIIHYCWLSNEPINYTFQQYINGWKKLMPDYEIIKWDTNKFDISSVPFVKQAYDNRKWAFAADYIRIYALYNYGGIYLDSDVEVLRPFDDFLNLKMMIGYENTDIKSLEVAVWGAEQYHPLLKDALDFYTNRKFILNDGNFNLKPLPLIIRDLIKNKGYRCEDVNNISTAQKLTDVIPIFHYTYFSPLSHVTHKNMVTKESYSIHHFCGSWLSPSIRIKLSIIAFIKRYLPFTVKIKDYVRKTICRL